MNTWATLDDELYAVKTGWDTKKILARSPEEAIRAYYVIAAAEISDEDEGIEADPSTVHAEYPIRWVRLSASEIYAIDREPERQLSSV